MLATDIANYVIYKKRRLTMCFKTITIFLLTTILISCHADFEIEPKLTDNTEQPQIIVSTQITGQVADTQGNVQNDYTLDLGTNRIEQNKRYFLERVEAVNKKGQYMEIFQDGEFKGFSHLLLLENDVNILDLHFFPELETIELSNGEDFALGSDSRIRIQEVLNSNGEKFSEAIWVSHRNLSESKYDFQLGNFGYDKSNKLVSIKAVDRFHIEMKAENGETLKIDSNKPAIYNYLVNSNSLGLFRFDQEEYAWVLEETLIDGRCNLNDAGYYMVAEFEDGVFTEGEVLLDGTTLSYQSYAWKKEATRSVGYTSLAGKFISVVPASSELEFTALDPCKALIERLVYNSSSEHEENIVFNLENIAAQFFNLSTRVISCDTTLNQQPAIQLFSDNQSYVYAFRGEEINTWLSACNSTFDVAGYNIADDSAGPILSWNTTTDASIQYLSDCKYHTEGFSYLEIRQDKKLYPSFDFSRMGNTTILEAQTDELKFIVHGNQVGSYAVEELNIKINDSNFGNNGYAVNCENSNVGCGIQDAFVSHYEDMSNGWIRITFAGEVWMQTLAPAAAGNFPIKGTILCKAN